MEEKALQYYKSGYNCSQCILKAAEATYGIMINKQSMNLCQGINTGFGVGGMCSVLIAGIMIFGMMFDDTTTKRLRMKLMWEFQERHRDFNCETLKAERKSGAKCEALVKEIASIIDKIIKEERR